MNDIVLKQLKALLRKKTILMGVGNPMRADDGLGPALARRVGNTANITSVICEDLPENFTGDVRTAKPGSILIADAIDFKGEPGEVVMLKPEDLKEERFSTHRPSLRLLMEFLRNETGAETLLVGIQPKSTGFSPLLSSEVDETVNKIAGLLIEVSKTADEDQA